MKAAEVREVSVLAAPELGVAVEAHPIASMLAEWMGLSGEWGCAHVVIDGLQWTYLSRDVELFRSLRVQAEDLGYVKGALGRALTRPGVVQWAVPGWPDEWHELWPALEAQGVVITPKPVSGEPGMIGRKEDDE